MPTLRCCAIIFMCAAVFGIMDVHLFHYVRDVPKPPRRGSGLLRAMARPLRDRRFVIFGSYTATMQFSLCFMTQFVSLYLIDRLGVRSGQVQLMLVAGPMLAQLLMLGAWGAAADRMGKRPVLLLAGLGLIPVGLGWMFVSPQHLWLAYVLLAAGTALWTGIEVANLNLVMDSAGAAANEATRQPGQVTGGGTAYVATNSVIINVAGCVGGLAAGLIAQALKDWHWEPIAGLKTFTSYDVLFATSALLRVAAVAIFLPYLTEPGARSIAETARFMLTLLSRALGDMATRALQPLRAPACEPEAQSDPESNAAPAAA
jgi:MFS family permease